MQDKIIVNTFWDSEANVWVAEGVNLAGLATHGETIEQLERKLSVMIPELLELNSPAHCPEQIIPFELVKHTTAKATHH